MAGASVVQRESAESGAPEASSAAVEAAGLGRVFGDLPVLDRVSFSVATGETLVVLGPNGAGKSTLLRILATLLRPSSGAVKVLGAELPRRAWKARGRIGYLGHEPMLYRDLTVGEALGFHAGLQKVADAELRIGELLDAVGMHRRRLELVRNLSAGQRQRLAVCRAVLHSPELLLLDEPGSHLDPQGRSIVEPLIGRASGVARVLVTHEVEAGLGEADRALALTAGGQVAYEGPAAGLSPIDAREIYERGNPG
jgi:heme exporter protein A